MYELDDRFRVGYRFVDVGDVGDVDGFLSGFECVYVGVGDGDCVIVFFDDFVKKDCLV